MTPEDKLRSSGEFELSAHEATSSLPTTEKSFEPPSKAALHPAVYVVVWIALSSNVILFNKWLLDKKHFHYPVILTAWHLIFATIMTQILARTTKLLDGRKTVKMTGRTYLRAIVPIGLLFSLSLIFGNLTYLHLSVAFIQMLKATTPVAVLLAGWAMGVAQPNLWVLFNVSFIVLGVVIASFGEITFVLIGFLYQCGGIFFESIRLVLVQKLLNGAEYKMDPLVSLYYFAPVCAVLNTVIALFWEVPHITKEEILKIGFPIFFANALVAFLLNVSAVFLIGKTSSLVLALCGILKDVLLVFASMLIWNTEVTALQFFGYAIAIAGLIYYKIGGEQLKGGLEAVIRTWSGFSAKRPYMRVLLIFSLSMTFFALCFGLLTPHFAPGLKDQFVARVTSLGASVGLF